MSDDIRQSDEYKMLIAIEEAEAKLRELGVFGLDILGMHTTRLQQAVADAQFDIAVTREDADLEPIVRAERVADREEEAGNIVAQFVRLERAKRLRWQTSREERSGQEGGGDASRERGEE